MVNPPWLTLEKVRLVSCILTSYERAYGIPLLACQAYEDLSLSRAQEVFSMQIPLLAHDIRLDPLITYVNAKGLYLWARTWSEMVGMPSKITASEDDYQERLKALNHAKYLESIQGYTAIRVDAK